jgi:hypothetical protein
MTQVLLLQTKHETPEEFFTNSSILIHFEKRLLFGFADRPFIRGFVFTGVAADAVNPVL